MRKPEQKLWDRLNKQTKHLVDWTRVETSYSGNGIPDLDGIVPDPGKRQSMGLEFKLELKVSSAKGYKIAGLYRPAQIAWQTKRSLAGGRVWNLLHHSSSNTLFLFHGIELPRAIDEGLQLIDSLRISMDDDLSSIIHHIRSN